MSRVLQIQIEFIDMEVCVCVGGGGYECPKGQRINVNLGVIEKAL